MNLEDQCVSLELAKKLKELGVEQKSHFYWVEKKNGDEIDSILAISEADFDNLYYLDNNETPECYINGEPVDFHFEVNTRGCDCCSVDYRVISKYSAFTSDELFELLPAWIDTKKNEPFNNFCFKLEKRTAENIRYIAHYDCDTFSAEEIQYPIISFKWLIKTYSPKLADCLAELLILIKEQGLG